MRGNDFMELRAFELVARHLSFTRAAEQIGVSRAALSGIVKNLEKRLGVQLLTRTTRNVALTDAGRELLDRLSPVLNELVSAVAHIDQFRETPRGRIRLLTCHVAAEICLKRLIPAFAQAQPEVTLDVCVEEGNVDMVAQGFDVAIRPEGQINQDLIAIKLGSRCQKIIVASTGYIRRHGRPKVPKDLAAHLCIKVVSPAVGDGDWRLLGPEGVVDAPVSEAFRANNFSFAMQAVLGDMGVALVPKAFAETALRDGLAEQLLSAYRGEMPPFYLCYPRHHCSSLAFRSLIDFVRQWQSSALHSLHKTASA